ncbi:MAG: hypothetical protein SCH39_02280 [Methanosarcinales archaeon]|nr:hypothetical protein [ANME-2 cluster archaeon]MDW7775147.1 hypothetical protein [Methanosarcinales archaeon]
MIVEDVVNYLIIFVGVLGTATILINVYILSKLGNSSLKRLGLQVLGLVIIFSIAGILRSYQSFFNYHSNWMTTLEYMIYSLVYIAASYELYDMARKYGFNIE